MNQNIGSRDFKYGYQIEGDKLQGVCIYKT